MKNKKWLLGGGILLVIVISSLILGDRQAVEVAKVTQGTLIQQVEDSGYIEEVEDYQLQATQQGRVTQVLVEIGQKIKPGEKLIVLENLDLAVETDGVLAQVAQVKAQLDAGIAELEIARTELQQAETDQHRQKKLLDSGALSPAEYEQFVLSVDKLSKTVSQQIFYVENLTAQLSSLENMHQNLTTRNQQLSIESPTQGIILDLPVKSGQVVSPGTLLAQVGTGELEARADILSDDLKEVKVGQKVSITAPLLGDAVIAGQVKKIYPQAYEKTSALGVVQRRVPVIITMNEPGKLRPGYEVRVSIQTLEKPDVLLVPREAVRSDGKGGDEVLAVLKGRIHYKKVIVGLKNPDKVEITGGLDAGEIIIRDASINLEEGSKVKMLP
ncbi:MAG: efflux RND transporter periplasmic adaptor subunit [Syntrophomonadaceae bacterium]|nr:efflux RND transporter periplasmic adaptor subunit [Syntrophomonadaceae bacterium]MDD3889538.1 efflux RND transporter periplasmic adaptor subunit [Syntrophomonadaceae bacterium]MDD4548539.1 efflux RND transporter periplasmic adaptor subunit [Syntrophomonadaceae bacterium]